MQPLQVVDNGKLQSPYITFTITSQYGMLLYAWYTYLTNVLAICYG